MVKSGNEKIFGLRNVFILLLISVIIHVYDATLFIFRISNNRL